MRKTKIICTLGPAIDDYDKLKKMVLHGLDCCRLNFSHGTHEEQLVRIERIKKLRNELGRSLPILLDTKGPEIRLRDFKNKSIELHTGDIFTLTDNFDELGDETHIGLTYPYLAKYVKLHDTILVDDGHVGLEVVELQGANVVCKVLNDGALSNHKSINIPNVIVDMPYLSDVDKSDILFGIENDVDYIAASFVRRKQDVLDLRKLLDDNGGSEIKIIAKIENTEGVKNMDDIIETADGVMVARGDLGVDVDAWDLPAIQKEMIYLAQASGKIVVTATQMLDSMQQNPRPTRAEVSDVHNAVLDGTSATMLSGESAQGDYPLEAVTYMAKIDERAEDDIDHELMIDNVLSYPNEKNEIDAIGLAVAQVANNFEVAAVVAEGDQELAFKISQYRPAADVFFATKERSDCRSLQLAWGVQPVCGKLEDAYKAAVASLNLEKGDSILEVTRDGVKFTQVK